MTKILLLAWVTLREALRQKLAVNLLLFALLLIAGSITLSELTFGEQHRINRKITGQIPAPFIAVPATAKMRQRTVQGFVCKHKLNLPGT